MSKLYLKTEQENTLGKERMEALAAGRPLMANVQAYSGEHAPRVEAVGVSHIRGLKAGEHRDPDMINNLSEPGLQGPARISRVVPGLDIAMAGFGGRTGRQAFMDGTLSQLLEDGVRMDGNSLLENWQTLNDANRIDVTIRKAMRPTVRELLFKVLDVPNATATMKIDDLYPYAFEFKENTGTGQAVEMGEATGGQSDTLDQVIYAAGFTYDLQKYLFDNTLDMTKVNDGIAIAESGKKDDLSLSPIFGYTYTAEAKTAAVTSGDTPEENTYLTMRDALDDIFKRRDPITQRRISPINARVLAGPIDAMHIAQIVDGFTNVDQNVKKRPSLSQISNIIGYEGERITGRAKDITYTDVPTGKAYIVVPNRWMLIAIKRTLQLNIDTNPSVLHLARELMAWWFVEGQYTAGIGYFIQEVTLPTW